MIALDIPLLNLKSPYYVVQDADGDLLFETDYGVKYGISFELNLARFDELAAFLKKPIE